MTTAMAHGMDGTLVDPDWLPLAPDEVREVLAHYQGCEEPFHILSASPRPFSAASVVTTRESRVFVKRHPAQVRNCAALREEHRFMEYLRRRGVSVPRVLQTTLGETAIETAEWTYEVHEIPPGVDLYQEAQSWTPFLSTAHAYSAGRTLAQMHIAADGLDAPVRLGRPLVAGFTIFASEDAEKSLDEYVLARSALEGYLQSRNCREEAMELLRPFHEELRPLRPALAPLWTHNDLHASNLFWSNRSEGAKVASVIDFGLCDRTNAVHDIAQSIERNIVEWLVLVANPNQPDRVPIHFDHLAALLEGYESVRRLSAQEAAALAPMMALCHAEFALSETDYFLTSLHSEEKAAMACEGYLVLHARWFHSAGRALLDSLRKWAQGRDRL